MRGRVRAQAIVGCGFAFALACRAPAVEQPPDAAGDLQAHLPTSVPPRGPEQERDDRPVVVQRAGVQLWVETPRPDFDGYFPLARGVMVDDPDASPGTRYLVLKTATGDDDPGLVVGELDLTGETRPPASDGTSLHYLECGVEDRPPRFAAWIDPPAAARLGNGEALVVLGPLRPDDRLARARAMTCDELTLPDGWACDLAVDTDADGRLDLLDVYGTCQGSPRCRSDERWRWQDGRWRVTRWWDRAAELWPRPALEIFQATAGPPEADDPRPGFVHLHGLTGAHVPRPHSKYLLIDGRGAVGLVETGAAQADAPPLERDKARFVHRTDGALRASLYAVGPVEGSWAELGHVRVRTDFDADKPVLALPYAPLDRDRVVVAVDRDADGRPEVELLATSALSLSATRRERLVRFELWAHDGRQRTLQERSLFWADHRRAILVVRCPLLRG